jgi:hypothetical protein
LLRGRFDVALPGIVQPSASRSLSRTRSHRLSTEEEKCCKHQLRWDRWTETGKKIIEVGVPTNGLVWEECELQ